MKPRGHGCGGRVHDERADRHLPDHRSTDFYELKLSYRPKESLIESKALKLYLWGFRDKGIFAEDLAATLLKDLVGTCDPVEMTVDLTQRVRGGLQIRTVVRQRGEE